MKLHSKFGLTALRFERALRTKGSRDHMQLHIIPLPARLGAKALGVFIQKASSLQLKFHEIADAAQSIDEVVVSMEGGPYQEYFYIEVPVSPADGASPARYKRFVCVSEEGSGGQQPRFPMQFGTEVRLSFLLNFACFLIYFRVAGGGGDPGRAGEGPLEELSAERGPGAGARRPIPGRLRPFRLHGIGE